MVPDRGRPRVFFDTSTVIAGAYSRKGASYVLLQLAAFGFLDGRISPGVREEALRNVAVKLPGSLAALRVLLSETLYEGPLADAALVAAAGAFSHPKDAVVLASAMIQQSHFLVTLNERDFWPPPDWIKVVRPGVLVEHLRDHVRKLLPADR